MPLDEELPVQSRAELASTYASASLVLASTLDFATCRQSRIQAQCIRHKSATLGRDTCTHRVRSTLYLAFMLSSELDAVRMNGTWRFSTDPPPGPWCPYATPIPARLPGTTRTRSFLASDVATTSEYLSCLHGTSRNPPPLCGLAQKTFAWWLEMLRCSPCGALVPENRLVPRSSHCHICIGALNAPEPTTVRAES